MYVSTEAIINQFLRTFPDVFSARELSRFLANVGIRVSIAECANYLESSPCVFALEKRMYMTRSGAFTGRCFSFKPTKAELAQQVFIAGHRFIPFVDNDSLSNSLQFYYSGNRLRSKIIELESGSALDLFYLYGEEYASQYIASDPANRDLNLYDFELPPRVRLTAFSIKNLLDTCDFHYGDRLLCKLLDWDNGKIEIVPLLSKENRMQINETDVNRQSWYEAFEKALLEEFEKMGPCSSIEEQLANVFFEHRDELCCANCGSVEEFFQYSKKVSIEYFGVETRLWYRGEDVPAIGPWNRVDKKLYPEEKQDGFSIPDFIVDSYLKDCMYQKKVDLKEILEIIFPKQFIMSSDDKKRFMLHITNRNAILLKKYNWFADFITGAVRHRALKLYGQISALVYDIDSTGKNLESFPQQELVILSQLFSHLLHILESIEKEPSYIVDDSETVMLSIEGMEYNFEDINGELSSAIAELHRNEFTVI